MVGDIKGKITILSEFMTKGEIKLKQLLEWHVHPISCLVVMGSYLYSAGR